MTSAPRTRSRTATFLPLLKRYPGLFYIDAHQQSTGYFFPPNEDPVHHEVSNFSLDFIQNRIGPALQQKFNDQSTAYRNYNTYDLFVPEYGDSVPSLLSGAAGMTFEKGTSEVYGKQVYDHYLAIDETVNVTVRDKVALLASWTEQWQEAVDQGERLHAAAEQAGQPGQRDDPPRGADRAAGLRLLLPAGQPRGRHGGAAAPHAAPGRARVPVRPGGDDRRAGSSGRTRRRRCSCPPGRCTSRWTSRSSTGSRPCSARTRTSRSTSSTTSRSGRTRCSGARAATASSPRARRRCR